MVVYLCTGKTNDLEYYEGRIKECGQKNDVFVEVFICEALTVLLFKLQDTWRYPDIIFLEDSIEDINGQWGAESLRSFGYKNDLVLLAETADMESVLRGYDVQALHYIVKESKDKDRFDMIFRMAYENAKSRGDEMMTFSHAGESRTVALGDIDYFEIHHRVITLHFGGDTFDFYSSLEKVEEMFQSKGFVRVHRSYVVALHHIAKCTYKEVVLKNGIHVPLGRTYVQKIKELYEDDRGKME